MKSSASFYLWCSRLSHLPTKEGRCWRNVRLGWLYGMVTRHSVLVIHLSLNLAGLWSLVPLLTLLPSLPFILSNLSAGLLVLTFHLLLQWFPKGFKLGFKLLCYQDLHDAWLGPTLSFSFILCLTLICTPKQDQTTVVSSSHDFA